MDASRAVSVVAVLFLVLGALCVVAGLIPEVDRRAPRLFGAGVTLAVVGFAMVVVTWVLRLSTGA